MSDKPTQTESSNPQRRQVAAELFETTPTSGGLMHWLLASPLLLFVAWVWVDLFAHYSPIPYYWVDVLLGLALMVGLVVLPLGVGAFWLVTSFPRLFQHIGWDVQPLEPVREAEAYLVRYTYHGRQRATTTWGRTWLRAAQGWVYIEIIAIFVGAVAMIPLFFSASEFGFGR